MAVGAALLALEGTTTSLKLIAASGAAVSILLANLLARDHWFSGQVSSLKAALAKSEANLENERNKLSAGAEKTIRAIGEALGAQDVKEISGRCSLSFGAVELALEELKKRELVAEVEPGRWAATATGALHAALADTFDPVKQQEARDYLRSLPKPHSS